MKRTFPIIIILISLSLLGLLLLQGSWLKNLIEVREGQLYNKLSANGLNVANDLYKSVYSGQIVRPRKSGMSGGFIPDFHLHAIKPLTIGEKYSVDEVSSKLGKEFLTAEWRHLKFEFAIYSPTGEIEMLTNGYEQASLDTAVNKRFIIPILPDESLTLDEMASY